ncbi:hypothetical protein K8T06_00520 [bacterium]|nr:hypothetical protein [bacterium]
MSEPKILKAGKLFHKKVQADWKLTAKDGKICPEHTISLSPKGSRHHKHGRLDIFVDDSGDFVSVIEIKSTDWDAVKPKNRKKLLGSHRRQVWRYIDRFIDIEKVDVCPGIIYKSPPSTPGLREDVEEYHNDWGLQVVWYEE